MNSDHRRSWLTWLAESLVVAAVYYVLARLGQILAIDPGNVTPIWPASGFALAVVLWRGYRVWLGLWLGNFLGNTWAILDLSTFDAAIGTLATGFAIGPGDVLQACLGAYLIRRFCASGELFGSTRGVFRFVGTQSIACLLSATFGVLALCLGSVVPWPAYGYTWLTWYLGDAVGVILVAPALLTLAMLLPVFRDTRRMAEAATILMLSVFASLIAFTDVSDLPLSFLPLPLVLWAAVRGDQFAVSVTVLVVSAVAISATGTGKGPFVSENSNLSLMLLQFYMSVTLVTGLAVATALGERRCVAQTLQQRNRALSAAEEGLRLAAVAFQTNDSIVITDKDGDILRVNESFVKLTGYASHEVIGNKPSILKSGRHGDEFYQRMWASINNDGYWEGEIWNKRKCGEVFPQRLTITCVKDKSGATTHYVAAGQDIRAHKQAAAHRTAVEVARHVQEGLFPSEPPCVPGLDVAGAVYPAERVSGDYFDFIPLRQQLAGFVVADVSGHGLGPALMMAQTQAYLRALAEIHDDPGEILTHVNRLLAVNNTDVFVTLFLGCIDPARQSFVYASAGHRGYLFSCDGTAKFLESTSMPLGVLPDTPISSAREVFLEPGDMIVVTTDGIEEMRAPDGTLFGSQRTLDVVRFNRDKPAADMVQTLYQAACDFGDGKPPTDDMTVVVVKCAPRHGVAMRHRPSVAFSPCPRGKSTS